MSNDLLIPNICGAGPLKAITYCCDSRQRPCIVRGIAMQILGLRNEDYISVKDEVGKEFKVDNFDELCFKNLAYCCSILKPCSRRDKVLQKLGWKVEDYLEFKKVILDKLMKFIKNPQHLDLNIVRKVLGVLISEDKSEFFLITGYTLPELGIFETEAILTKDDIPSKDFEEIKQGFETKFNVSELIKKYLGNVHIIVPIPRDTYVKLRSKGIDVVSKVVEYVKNILQTT